MYACMNVRVYAYIVDVHESRQMCAYVILAHQRLLRLITAVPPYSTPGTSLCKTPILTSANEITHEERGRSPIMCYNCGWFQSRAALIIHSV